MALINTFVTFERFMPPNVTFQKWLVFCSMTTIQAFHSMVLACVLNFVISNQSCVLVMFFLGTALGYIIQWGDIRHLTRKCDRRSRKTHIVRKQPDFLLWSRKWPFVQPSGSNTAFWNHICFLEESITLWHYKEVPDQQTLSINWELQFNISYRLWKI